MFFSKRRLALSLVLFLFISVGAHAETAIAKKYKIALGGEAMTFQAEVSKTRSGVAQVAYVLNESKTIFLNAHFVILTGRDLDGDGKIDTWFFSNDVQKAITQIAQTEDGWDVAQGLVSSHPLLSAKDNREFFREAIANLLPISGAQHEGFEKSILNREIDLVSIELRVRQLHDQHLITVRSELVAYTLLSDGWGDIARRVYTVGLGGYAAAIVADVTFLKVWMWASDLAITVVSKTTAFVGQRMLATPAGEFLSESFERFSSSISKKASSMALKAAKLAPIRLTYSAAQNIVTRMTLPQIEKLIFVRDAVAKIAVPMIKAGASQWDYIVLNVAVQTPIEIWGRRKELYDPQHPERLVPNILKDKDMMQNIAYMLVDSTLQTAVSTYFPKEQMARRMIICGFISTVDSLAMSTMFKHETDPIRAGLDTGWEATIGNAQTQFDLRSFEILAERLPNSKPRLLGYAVAITDQALGFLGYFYATKWYEKGGGHDLLHHFFENPFENLKLNRANNDGPVPKPTGGQAEAQTTPDYVVPPLNFYLLPVTKP